MNPSYSVVADKSLRITPNLIFRIPGWGINLTHYSYQTGN